MLFNSYEFLFAFLPVVLGVFMLLSLRGWWRLSGCWLGAASVFFYGYWVPEYVLLLLSSIAMNYLAGRVISNYVQAGQGRSARKVMIAGVAINLLLLGYYKYANFFADAIRSLSGLPLPGIDVVLPIGISFFTFTQIAFLVDCQEGKVKESDPVYYLLFVTYFPHLIAGPVLHHAEMMPQFARRETYRWIPENIVAGVAFFLLGLFKKVVLADGIQPYVGPVFDHGPSPDLVTAWGAALAYTLQLYFDFSGYSDMAVGLSRLFNVRLPFNFNSPYKASNISEFWRRWHMTLSRFLRDYLYIRLGGNRKGPVMRYMNLLVTMVLGGLWHGAGWTFVVWGGLHGLYLIVNHAWQAIFSSAGRAPSPVANGLSRLVTFIAVVVAWVFFRATTFSDAVRVLSGMAGLFEIVIPELTEEGMRQFVITLVLLAVAWMAPNSQEVVARWIEARRGTGAPALADMAAVRWSFVGAALVMVLLLAVINGTRGASEFIYFNF